LLCERAAYLICARLDGELLPGDRAALEGHLSACASCRATAEAFDLQDNELRRAFGPRRAAAEELAVRVGDRVLAEAAPRPPRRAPAVLRVSALTAGLGAVVAMYFFVRSQWGPNPRPTPALPLPASRAVAALPGAAPDHLTPRPLDPAPAPPTLIFGQFVETKAGERRRLSVPPAGVLYVDQNTRFRFDGAGQGTLSAGAVFYRGPGMTVKSPDRMVNFSGGSGEVRTDGNRTGVFVAGGVAQVAPHNSPRVGTGLSRMSAGQELEPGGWSIGLAPRASGRLAWTRDLIAEGETPLVPASSYGGGALVAVDANGQEAKLSLRKFHLDVHVEDGFARTTIDQTFFNHHPWRLEGTFYFPLPPDASLSRLAMYVDGKLMEGGMAERAYARAVYQQIVSSQRDPALLEWVDGSTFRMRVFPLEGRQEKRIVLSYSQRLADVSGKTVYRFPAGHSLRAVRDWSLRARVKGGAGLRWESPTHPSVKGAAAGDDLVLTDEGTDVRADRDLVLELSAPGGPRPAGEARFAAAELDGAKYLMLRYRPELAPSSATPAPRNWVFLFESSADRDPLLARAQAEVVRHVLADAAPQDTFNVVTAGTRTRRFAPAPLPVASAHLAGATEFLDNTHLIGALDLGAAFDDVAALLKGDNAWLVHLGSGYTALGAPEAELARHLPAGARYVGVGVGKRWNRALMRALAERTGGFFTQINPDESIAWRSFDLVSTLDTPRLQGVTVTADGPGAGPRPAFLADGSTVCQGEELWAVARLAADDGKPLPAPKSVTVRGSVEGRPFTQTLPVRDVVPGAGYLPRTWAKLEIDRLLAAGAAANRPRVVELSKAMYVMSPFTSLLVLENDAMYAQYKVDRGRKDHWAMYPCPPRIPVVYEPDPTQPVDVRNAPAGEKLQANQVLQTVLLRAPPRFLRRPGSGSRDWFPLFDPITGRRLNSLDEGDQTIVGGDNNQIAYHPPSLGLALGRATGIQTSSDQPVSFNGRAGESQSVDARSILRASGLSERPLDPAGQTSGEGFGEWETQLLRQRVPSGTATHRRASRDFLVEGFESGEKSTYDLDKSVYDLLVTAEDANTGSLILGGGVGQGSLPGRGEGKSRAPTADTAAGFQLPPDYHRLTFAGDPRLFSDLAAYAPGLNTSPADIQAVLEAEAAPDLRASPGHIDPDARRLIDAARTGGWQTVTLPAGKGRPDLVLTFDGAGRYAYERTLPTGLFERVVCDGETILHLYPELGVGARRPVTRFHRAALQAALPGLVLPAEDLARGADVRSVDDHTVAVVPHGEKPARALHLVFSGGRLVERRVVEADSKKVVSRVAYDGAGGVRLLDAAGREKNQLRRAVRPAKEPELRPDTSAFVVLPLPFRSREHVFEKYGLDPSEALSAAGNEWHQCLGEGPALELLAVALATQNAAEDARTLFEGPLAPVGEKRRGMFTLITSCGFDPTQTEPFRQALREHPEAPLLRYLFLRGSKVYELALRYLPLRAGNAVGGDGLLHRLAVLHDLTARWRSGLWHGADMERTVAFVRRNAGSPLARALVSVAQDNLGGDRELARDLAGARGVLAEAGGGYADRYEQARLLFEGGRKDEAARRFTELYAAAVREGLLPPFDGSLREALLGGDRWGLLLRETAQGFVRAKRRPAAVALAWQCLRAGDPPLADNLLALALEGAPEGERPAVTVAAVEYLRRTQAPFRADALLHDLMASESPAQDARLWRLRSAVATDMGNEDAAVTCLVRALDLEYRDLPAVIDLASWRADYVRVLRHCRKLAEVARTLGVKPPPDLQLRTVRAADRWRAHDPEAADACETAAATFADLDEPALAWDYLTTAAALRSPGSPSWRQLAESRHAGGDFAMAERAYAAACAAEPGDALLLWERARNLRQAGRTTESVALLRRLVDEEWPRDTARVRDRARWQLGEQ
jgi:hypothetical protein